jgi:cell division septum initiation protein DivIVA
MDQGNTSGGDFQETPMFDASRRGYDPEQVDRYLEQQLERLGETTLRAREAEQRLGTAVKQLRAMNARITQLEQNQHAQAQTAQPSIPIDILGDRVQRILQEAWDGAFALRQSVENEATQLREQALTQAQSIVEEARTKARSIEEQMRRRRDAYLARVEQDKAKAVAQMTFLSDQRKAATAELLAIKERIEAAIADVPTQTAANLSLVNAPIQTVADLNNEGELRRLSAADEALLTQRISEHPSGEAPVMRFGDTDLPPTMPVHMLPSMDVAPRPADTSSLVRSHRESSAADIPTRRRTDRPTTSGARVFDFEANQDK